MIPFAGRLLGSGRLYASVEGCYQWFRLGMRLAEDSVMESNLNRAVVASDIRLGHSCRPRGEKRSGHDIAGRTGSTTIVLMTWIRRQYVMRTAQNIH